MMPIPPLAAALIVRALDAETRARELREAVTNAVLRGMGIEGDLTQWTVERDDDGLRAVPRPRPVELTA